MDNEKILIYKLEDIVTITKKYNISLIISSQKSQKEENDNKILYKAVLMIENISFVSSKFYANDLYAMDELIRENKEEIIKVLDSAIERKKEEQKLVDEKLNQINNKNTSVRRKILDAANEIFNDLVYDPNFHLNMEIVDKLSKDAKRILRRDMFKEFIETNEGNSWYYGSSLSALDFKRYYHNSKDKQYKKNSIFTENNNIMKKHIMDIKKISPAINDIINYMVHKFSKELSYKNSNTMFKKRIKEKTPINIEYGISKLVKTFAEGCNNIVLVNKGEKPIDYNMEDILVKKIDIDYNRVIFGYVKKLPDIASFNIMFRCPTYLLKVNKDNSNNIDIYSVYHNCGVFKEGDDYLDKYIKKIFINNEKNIS